MADLLVRIDRAVAGLCPCGAEPRPGSTYCSRDCEPTYLAEDSSPCAMRWQDGAVTGEAAHPLAAGSGVSTAEFVAAVVEERRRWAIVDWLRANGIDLQWVPRDAAIVCDGEAIRCEVYRQSPDGGYVLVGDEFAMDEVCVPMTVPPPPEAGVSF